MSSVPVAVVLSRRTVSAFGAWAISSATSVPIMITAGGVSAAYAGSHLAGVTVVLVAVGATVGLLLVGYSMMLREVAHSAPYYAIVGRGLGRELGVAAGSVALLSYNALQISLYGLLGIMASGVIGVGAWWIWANVGIGVVAFMGGRRVTLSIRTVVTALGISLLALLSLVVAALSGTTGGLVTGHALAFEGLMVPGFGLAVALTVAAYTSLDGVGSLVEEEKTTGALSRGMFAAAASLTAICIGVAWAASVAFGRSQGSAAVAAGLPLAHATTLGSVVVDLATLVLIFTILAPLLTLHHVISRYTFCIARERVLPAALARTDPAGAAPVGASRSQTALAVVVVNGFAIADADPARGLFGWLSVLGAMGLLVLLLAANIAALKQFAGRTRTARAAWTRVSVPLLGVILGAAILAIMLWRIGPMVQAGPSSWATFLAPALIVVAALAGLARAANLRTARPAVHAGIGYGVPHTYDVPDVI